MDVLLVVLAVLGPPFGAIVAWWLNSKSEARQRAWAVADREVTRQATLEDRALEERTRKNEWLRDLRRGLYTQFLSVVSQAVAEALNARHPVFDDANVHKEKALALIHQINEQHSTLVILATREVWTTSESLRRGTLAHVRTMVGDAPDEERDTTREELFRARGIFIDAAQAELGIL